MELYLFENLLKARDEAELKHAAQLVAEKLGYDYFCYGLSYRRKDTGGPQNFVFSSYPQPWLDRYFECSYINIDPATLQCFSSTLPAIWTHKYFGAPGVVDMHHEAVSVGISGGVCLPIHSPWLNGAGILSLANAEDTDKAVPHVIETLGLGQLFACYLNEAVRRLLLPEDFAFRQNEELSRRELECLLRAGQGLSAKLIADRMGISSATVSHHLGNIRRKLGAATTREAVALAVHHRLITP